MGIIPSLREHARGPWFWTLSSREQHAVCFSLRVNPESLLFRDVSQSLGSTRVSTRSEDGTHCACAVLPSQMMMVFHTGQPYRLLLGREALVLQGFPSRDPSLSELIEGTTELLMTNIAGNMVSTPVMLAIAMAAISSVSWRSMPRPHEAHASTSGETALALLRSIVPLGPALGSEDVESED